MTNNIVSSFLCADIYPHTVSRIEFIETHISLIFLTGEFAYKIKKPLSLDFVDYSSLAARKFFCFEELRLNRRYARDYYLDVVTITCTKDNIIALDGDGDIIDYAVKMKQFPSCCVLYDLMPSYGEYSVYFEQLGSLVAQFHLSQPSIDRSGVDGDPLSVGRMVQDNFTTIGQLDDPQLLRSIQRWSQTHFNAFVDEFQRRKQDGFIRDCHGDLHLGNIAVIDGKPLMFDGIDFDSHLRCVDTISEIAFVLVDLELFGAYQAATIFLNHYLDVTGDYGGLVLLNFYKVYRAMVRAKIALIKSRQSNSSDDYQRFQRYCQLAGNYVRDDSEDMLSTTVKHPQTQLIITHGISGSGKTTQARKAVKEYCAIHLRSDVIRKSLFGLDSLAVSGSSLNGNLYNDQANAKTYQYLAQTAESLLKSGFNVIVDASFLKKVERDRFKDIVKRTGSGFSILDCPVSTGEAIARIMARKNDPSEATQAVVEHQVTHRDLLTEKEVSCRLIL